MTNIPGSEQWRKYPLDMASFDPVRMDGELEHRRIDLRSKDLFDEISEPSLEVLESGGKGMCHLPCMCGWDLNFLPGGGLSVKTFENAGLLDDHLKEKVRWPCADLPPPPLVFAYSIQKISRNRY